MKQAIALTAPCRTLAHIRPRSRPYDQKRQQLQVRLRDRGLQNMSQFCTDADVTETTFSSAVRWSCCCVAWARRRYSCARLAPSLSNPRLKKRNCCCFCRMKRSNRPPPTSTPAPACFVCCTSLLLTFSTRLLGGGARRSRMACLDHGAVINSPSCAGAERSRTRLDVCCCATAGDAVLCSALGSSTFV